MPARSNPMGFATHGPPHQEAEHSTAPRLVATIPVDPRLRGFIRMVVEADGGIELLAFPTQLQIISATGMLVIGLGQEQDLHVDYAPPAHDPGPPVALMRGCASGGGFLSAAAEERTS